MRVATMIRSILCITALIALSSSFVYSKLSNWDEGRARNTMVVALAAFSDTDKLKDWTCRWCVSGWLGKMTLVDPIWKNGAGIKGVILHDDATIYIAYGGTNQFKNWITNLHFSLRQYPPDAQSWVHRGFYNAMVSSRSEAKAAVRKAMKLCPTCKKALFTGHSMGGAIAMLSALDMSSELKGEGIEISAITFGQPRVGNKAFANYVKRELPDLHRVVHKGDIVPHQPPSSFGYAHPPQEIWERTDGYYIQCPTMNGETRECSNSEYCYNFGDHNRYMGISVVW